MPEPNLIATPQMAYYHAPTLSRVDLRCVRIGQMQGAEDKAEGSILLYVTKAESDSNTADGLLSRTDYHAPTK